jgi:AcrR family transcriptional regulator
MTEAVTANSSISRGAATRAALLDAGELLVADHGFRSPSHRMIARQAGAHVALVNYHFSSKEMLFETIVSRRASRLTDAWRNALARVRSRPTFAVEDVLDAWWEPFQMLDKEADPPWANYLCVIARLASANDGEVWHRRYFGAIDRSFLEALAIAMPSVRHDDLEAGFRYARCLYGEVLLYRCGRSGGVCRPPGFRENDVERLRCYIANGFHGLRQEQSMAAE